jgi:putative glutamine amidotransferase
MQILNVALGGTMRQHVTTEAGPHRPEPTDYDAIKRHGHEIEITPGSRLAQLYGTTHRWVNSYHHQGLERVAEPFSVVARSDDDLVEAIEHDGSWACLGVQWHPEKTLDGSDDPLFAAFVDDVRRAAERAVA